MSAKTHLHALTGVRALAALWVVFLHFREPFLILGPNHEGWDRLTLSGYLGVDVFFVLSGFVISYNYLDRLSEPSLAGTREYLGLRFARIYPVHLATLMLTGLLVGAASLRGMSINSEAAYSPVNFVMNALMLQAVPPGDSWNPPAWSISVEFGAYLAFPLLALLLAKVRTTFAALTCSLAVVIVGGWIISQVADQPNLPGYTFAWTRIAVEFVLGCLIYIVWRTLQSRNRGRAWDAVAVLGALAIGVSIATSGPTKVMFIPILTVGGVGLLILGCAGATGPFGRFLSSKPMVWGGRISYSVYMTHFLIATVLGKIVSWERLAESTVIVRFSLIGGCLVLVVAVGAACYHFVEEPSRKWLRRRVARRELQRGKS